MSYDDYEPDWSEGEDMEAVKPTGEGIKVEINSYALERIEAAAAAGVRQQLAARIDAIIQENVDAIVEAKLNEAIGKITEETVMAYLAKPRQKTNAYGEYSGGGTVTLSELIPHKVESWMTEPVKADGTPARDHYDRKDAPTRLNWIISKFVRAELDVATKAAASTVSEEAKKVVAAHVGKFVAEQMIPQIELNGHAR